MAYDVSKAFAKIEDELISSMVRNLKNHRAMESTEGIKWTQWQVMQLKALEDYKINNRKKFTGEFEKINGQVEQLIRDSYNDGETSQEKKILQAINKGYNLPHSTSTTAYGGQTKTEGAFFRVNERKLNALIEATTHDMSKAETAVLRMANDKYRQIIYDAQVYANAGGTTYEKAVDMATKDFLSAGINCIEYKNGARHTISDYADMAIKTANKRAYLRGEGAKREEWGIHTVIVNKRGNACPLCAPFCGQVFIDDVYGTGSSKDGDYPLLSSAVAAGFLHPRCQDAYTTYFEGISTPPSGEKLTQEDVDKINADYEQRQKQRYAEKQAHRMERMSKYSLDPDNRRAYGARAEQWREKADWLAEQNENAVHRITDSKNLKNNAASEAKKAKNSVENSKNSDIIEFEKGVTKEIQEVFDAEFDNMQQKFGKVTTISRVGVLNSKNSTAYGEFCDNSGELLLRFANKKNALAKYAQKTLDMKKSSEWSSSHPLHIFRHEIGHAIQLEHKINDPLWGEKLEKIADMMRSLPEFNNYEFKGKYSVSKYAMDDINEFISECIAESMTSKARKTSKQIAKIILGGS